MIGSDYLLFYDRFILITYKYCNEFYDYVVDDDDADNNEYDPDFSIPLIFNLLRALSLVMQ